MVRTSGKSVVAKISLNVKVSIRNLMLLVVVSILDSKAFIQRSYRSLFVPKTRDCLFSPIHFSRHKSLKRFMMEKASPIIMEDTSNDNCSSKISKSSAIVVPCTISSLTSCATRLLAGDLVSFPTETVYGLGANGINPSAIQKIYKAKRRPKTCPLILHVYSPKDALVLWDTSSDTDLEKVLHTLSYNFFPGPLTLVAKANSSLVPDIVTASTGFVAVRSPSHSIARKLLSLSKIPIAAPSANLFGHVSPTKSSHVLRDLCEEDVWIVDSEDGESCSVGVESTVAKVDGESKTVSILRHGAVSIGDLKRCLEKNGLENVFQLNVQVRTTNENISNVSPGQSIRHYSPNVKSFLLSIDRFNQLKQEATPCLNSREEDILKSSVVVDFAGQLRSLETKSLSYKDLSLSGDSKEAASKLFETLHWAEEVEGVKRIFFPEITGKNDYDSLLLALKDRLTRAASGLIVDVIC